MDIDERQLRQLMDKVTRYIDDADKREARADDRAKMICEMQRKGFETLTRSLDQGLRVIADTIREATR